jgi:hypothetical protein
LQQGKSFLKAKKLTIQERTDLLKEKDKFSWQYLKYLSAFGASTAFTTAIFMILLDIDVNIFWQRRHANYQRSGGSRGVDEWRRYGDERDTLQLMCEQCNHYFSGTTFPNGHRCRRNRSPLFKVLDRLAQLLQNTRKSCI